jgi:hypothetical protein
MMEPLTLGQIGDKLAQAAKKIPPHQRLSFSEVMRLLHTPVGALPKIGEK